MVTLILFGGACGIAIGVCLYFMIYFILMKKK